MKKLKSVLEYWQDKPNFDEFFLYIFDLTRSENEKFTEFMQDCSVMELQRVFDQFKDFEPKIGLIGQLELKDEMLLQGFRKTVGSVAIQPPSFAVLVLGFEKQWHEKDPLSVGARALSKHVHRSRNGWYGLHEKEYKGPSIQKNALAKSLLERMIRDSIWFNVHSLPHSVLVFEIRVRQGFGCRWSINGDFRGFLEPMMADGHENKWRHG